MPKNEAYRPFLEAMGSLYQPKDIASALIEWAAEEEVSLDGLLLQLSTRLPINLHGNALRALLNRSPLEGVQPPGKKGKHGTKGKA